MSPKPGFGVIFQDSTADTNTAEEAGGIARSSIEGSPRSPCLKGAQIKMLKLREISLNEKTPPPLGSPLAKQVRGRKTSRLKYRSASAESSKYIEHLESQLAAVNAKLDSMMSPTANKARAAKLRALTIESRSLRQDLSGWENSFEARIEEEVKRRSELETRMRSQIQDLHNEMEFKDAKLRELGWEIESMRSKVAEAEGLEEMNLKLERRIDLLSSLVAQSPTKLGLRSATSSPSKMDQFNRAPRPKSMLPTLPSSPGGVKLSLSTVVEAGFWSSRRSGSTSSMGGSPGGAAPMAEEQHEREKAVGTMSQTAQSKLFSGVAASSGSVPFASTRPTSIQSTSSLGLTSPELPLPIDFEAHPRSTARQRRMRRFPSGSCTLKPLILPNTAATPSLPTSAPVQANSGFSQRDISNISLDPTTAFLSNGFVSSPPPTPTQTFRQRSATWAQEQTLKALEGSVQQSQSYDVQGNGLVRPSLGPISDWTETVSEAPVERQIREYERPLSLDKELERAQQLSPDLFDEAFSGEAFRADEVTYGTEIETIPIHADLARSQTPLSNQCLRPKTPSTELDNTPKLPQKRNLTVSSPRSVSLASVATTGTFGIFRRLANMITRVKQDPVVLAQRLLRNAWTVGSAEFGGIGWWLLGVVFGSNRHERGCAADRTTAEENPASSFNWSQFSATASKRRIGEQYLRDQKASLPAATYQISLHRASDRCRDNESASQRAFSIAASPQARNEPNLFPCYNCIEPASRRTFRLWFHFSLAIVLAVGVAIKHGPGTLLAASESNPHYIHHQILDLGRIKSPARFKGGNIQSPDPRTSGEASLTASSEGQNGEGGYNLIFAKPLGPADFEKLAKEPSPTL